MPFTPELLNLGVGLFTGFVFKYWAQQAQDRAQMVELLIKKQQMMDDSANQAAERVPIDIGKWTRRIIVFSILSALILFPALFAFFENRTTVVQEITPEKSWFLGLFKTGGNLKFFEVSGYLILPEVRQAMLALIGFYFGNGAAKRK